MKTIFYVLVVTLNIFAQWQLVNPKITLFDIEDISIVNNKASMINSNGEFFNSSDGFLLWNKISTLPYPYYNKLFLSDSSNGWLLPFFDSDLTSDTFYYHTSNGGYNWNTKYLDFYPFNIFFYDSINGISSSWNTIYLTKNGGKTFNRIIDSAFFNSWLPDYTMKNKNNIVVLTNKIIESNDGGLTWNSYALPPKGDYTGNYDYLIFQDSLTGFVLSTYMEVLKTTDGGKKWVKKLEPDSDGHIYLEDVEFVGNTGFITKDIGWFLPKTNDNSEQTNVAEEQWFNILRTTDNGETWYNINNRDSKFYEPAIKVEGINDSTFLFTGHNGFLCITTDKGETFNSINHSEYFGRIKGINFINDSTGFIIANQIYKTYDGGKSFEKIQTDFDGFKYLNWAAMPDTNTIIASTYIPEDYLIKSTDLGKTWKRTLIGTSIYYLKFINNTTGYFSTVDDLYKTTNQGDTWEKYLTNTSEIEYLDSNHIWIVSLGHILFSSDNGLSWNLQAILNVGATKFADINNGIAVGKPFYYTTNGGLNWEPSTGPEMNEIDKIKAFEYIKVKDRLYGFTCISPYNLDRGYSKIYYTLDSGKTWIKDMDVPNTLDWFSFAGNTLWGASFKRGFLIKRNDFETITNIQPEIKPQSLSFTLSQNYPNPFNPSTKIKYTLPKQGLVTIKVYDVLGKEIKTLLHEEKPSGEYEVDFDGSRLSSGIYFYQIQAGEFLNTKKMILMK
ncbi:MAG TPA: T9SS type A sorting domain-containing protein [Ignavibacteriaceae bacterium]|nr:T9SS type A sorting domain-containing protein [Ignavibacteriaceae bacterium]